MLTVVDSQPQAATQALLAALQPDEATVGRILADPRLLEGFDDPAVMAAVTDVAAHPARMSRYAGNPKVCEVGRHLGPARKAVPHSPFSLILIQLPNHSRCSSARGHNRLFGGIAEFATHVPCWL